MSWDDPIAFPEPFEPADDWRGGAGEEPDDLDRRPYRADPTRPHPADCACEVHGKPRPLSWWRRP